MQKTLPNPSPSRLLTGLLSLLALGAAAIAVLAPLILRGLAHRGPDYASALREEGIRRLAWITAAWGALTVVAMIFAARTALIPKPWAITLVRFSFIFAYVLLGFYIYDVIRTIDVVVDRQLPVNGDDILNIKTSFWLKWRCNAPAIAALLAVAWLHLLTWHRSIVGAYQPAWAHAPLPAGSLAAGGIRSLNYAGFSPDEPVRVRAKSDIGYRNGMTASILVHILIIFIVPWLVTTRGCTMERYLMPGGSGGGGGAPQPVQVKVAKKKPKRHKYVFRPNSAISFRTPDMTDSQVAQNLDKETEDQLKVDPNDVNAGSNGPGGAGSGFGKGGGKGGGFGNGDPNAKIRFIRLQYNGLKWDDGMDSVSRADANFLDELHKVGPKVEGQGEAITAGKLRTFQKGYQPPFLFMTGEGGIDMPDAEIKVIRQYLLDGGMLFADCGSDQWNGAFHAWTRRLFPDKQLLDISNDDIIFHCWFHFSNGAPPLWHHGGQRALGIKHDGRWVVFYHPGNINDAWKTGHGSVESASVKQAYEMGINVVYYAFSNYANVSPQGTKH